MLSRFWEYVIYGTNFGDKFVFVFGFAVGASGSLGDGSANTLNLIFVGLLTGFFCLGAWKFAKSAFRR